MRTSWLRRGRADLEATAPTSAVLKNARRARVTRRGRKVVERTPRRSPRRNNSHESTAQRYGPASCAAFCWSRSSGVELGGA